MTTASKIMRAAVLGISLAGLLASCEKGPAEKVGQKIDEGVDKAKDAAKDIKDDVTKKR
jgi:hypothetical protein